MTQKYCVWEDNLLEELFAIEQIEFDNLPKLKAALITEKNTINIVDAESITDAMSVYKKMKGINSDQSEEEAFIPKANVSNKKSLH